MKWASPFAKYFNPAQGTQIISACHICSVHKLPLIWRGGDTTDKGSSAGSDVCRTEDSVQVGSLSPAVILSDYDDDGDGGGGSSSSGSDGDCVDDDDLT